MDDQGRKITIRPLSANDLRSEFDCGVPALNTYLQSFARQHEKISFTKTFVAVHDGEALVLGYYSLASSLIERKNLSEKFPPFPVPAQRIARLACDRKAQGKGLGKLLLLDALRQILAISKMTGVGAVEVDAKDENAKEFYTKFGFKPLGDHSLHLYLPMKQLKTIFSEDETP